MVVTKVEKADSEKNIPQITREDYLLSLYYFQQGDWERALEINPSGLGGDGDRVEDPDSE